MNRGFVAYWGAKWRRCPSTKACQGSGCLIVGNAQNLTCGEKAVIGDGSLAGARSFALCERE